MKRALLTMAVLALGATGVAAQDPIAARQELMKGIGKQTKMAAAMAKGAEPFDLEKAKAAFAAYQDAAEKAPALFPDDSKTGGDTEADPKIWENKADFEAKFVKLGADAKAAAASVSDLDSFRVAFGGVVKNCGGCHEDYRVKK